MDELKRQNEELKALLAVSMKRIAELEAQLDQNSGNSSKPPSSDLGRKRKPPVEPSGRKRGGQPGHDGKTRDVVPESEVDAVVDRDPEQCERCEEPLVEAPRLDACIRQVCETPEFKAFIQQFNLWQKRCPKCGHLNRGRMPAGSPKGAFGPRIQARIGILTGRYRMTRREVVSLSKAMFGVRISLGSVQACCKAVSEAAAETAQAIHAEVKQAPSVHADETGFGRCGKNRMWLWVAAGGGAEAFRLLPGRGREQAEDLLGETGTQGCMLKLASDQAFHLWHQFERGEIDRKELIRWMKPIQADIRRRLETLRDGPDTTKKARGTAKDILRQWDSLWVYIHHDGAVPTNNEAERSIRKAVLWRKVSLGVDSEDGARFAERMLTLAGTARRRGIDLLAWLTRALQAKLEERSPPAFQAR